MQKQASAIDLKEIYTNFLKKATPNEKVTFLINFIEFTDTLENVNDVSKRIQDFEKNSEIQLDPGLVKKAVRLLNVRKDIRVKNLQNSD